MTEITTIPDVGVFSVVQLKRLNPDCIDFIDTDMALFDSDGASYLYDGPRKMSELTVGLCLNGSASFSVSLREQKLVAGRMVAVLPNQIIEYKEISQDFKAVFFIISRDMFELLPQKSNILSLIFFFNDSPCSDLTEIEQDMLLNYYHFIRKRMRSSEKVYQREITRGLMQSFFFELCSIFHRHVPESLVSLRSKTRKEHLFERFYQILTEHYKSERSVRFYADQLCLTPKYLSETVKKISGKTTSQWIDELVILEAKALLSSSDMNIQEIADQLHFANQSFFGKYFKNHVGVSPKEYRNGE